MYVTKGTFYDKNQENQAIGRELRRMRASPGPQKNLFRLLRPSTRLLDRRIHWGGLAVDTLYRAPFGLLTLRPGRGIVRGVNGCGRSNCFYGFFSLLICGFWFWRFPFGLFGGLFLLSRFSGRLLPEPAFFPLTSMFFKRPVRYPLTGLPGTPEVRREVQHLARDLLYRLPGAVVPFRPEPAAGVRTVPEAVVK